MSINHGAVGSRIKRLIRSKLPTGQFSRGVTLLAGSNALGQFMMLAASPILTRLYSPEDFGLLALYMAITGTVHVVLSLRYDLAINLAQSVFEALAVVKLCISIVVLFSIATLIFVSTYGSAFASLLGAPELANYLWMLPVSVFLLGCFGVFNKWCVRESAFGLIGAARLKQVFASLVIQIGGAFLGPVALIGGQVANQSVGMASLGRKPITMPEFRSVSFADMRQVFVRYKRFPLFSTWASLLNRGSLQLPTFMFVFLFGPAVAGFYAIANRVITAPSSIFVNAINNVFLKSAASAHQNGNLRELTLSTHKNSTLITLPPLLLLALLAPELFVVVFGEQWLVAGEFARWMTILVFFRLVASPLTVLFSILEKQTHDLIFQAVLMLSRVLALLLGARAGDPVFAIMVFAIASGLCYSGFLIWVCVQIGGGFKAMLHQSVRALIMAITICAPVMIVYALELSLSIKIVGIVASSIMCLIYTGYLLKKIT